MCKLCSKAVQDVTFVLHVVHYHPSDATGIEIKQTFVTKLISKKFSLQYNLEGMQKKAFGTY